MEEPHSRGHWRWGFRGGVRVQHSRLPTFTTHTVQQVSDGEKREPQPPDAYSLFQCQLPLQHDYESTPFPSLLLLLPGLDRAVCTLHLASDTQTLGICHQQQCNGHCMPSTPVIPCHNPFSPYLSVSDCLLGSCKMTLLSQGPALHLPRNGNAGRTF